MCIRIIDTVNLIKKYSDLARESNDAEYCAIAIGKKLSAFESCYKILDYCSVNDLGGHTTLNGVSIPRKISYSLIKSCVQTGNIPIVLHTHVPASIGDDYVSFSNVDREYISRFSLVAMKSGYTSECLFIVTDGNTVMVCEKSPVTERYILL